MTSSSTASPSPSIDVNSNTNSSSPSISTPPASSDTWNKTAGQTNGDDWAIMTPGQKLDIVNGVISSWKANNFTVDVDASYFIDGLNSFYGSPATNSTNLAQAMSLIGTAGKVLHENQ